MTDRPAAAVLVAGLGNEMRRDDGAGILVARELRARAVAPGIEVREQPGEPISLLDAWRERDAAVLVDAMSSGAAPGTIVRLDALASPLPEMLGGASSTHAISLAETLELARALYRLPSRLIVFAIEGRDFTAGNQLSQEVRLALPRLADAVLQEASRLCAIPAGRNVTRTVMQPRYRAPGSTSDSG